MTLLLMVVAVAVAVVQGHQSYVANKQLDCYNNYDTTDGYLCNGAAPSCVSYLTFRSIDPLYNSPTSIAYLLNSTPQQIAAANNISDVDPIPANTPLYVPVNCSCSGNYSQHNASYTLKTLGETYFSVANNTYQGLTACQALIHQNPTDSRNLTVGLVLEVPIRCACPTVNQTAAGIKYLVAYLVDWNDDLDLIAQRFGVDVPTLLEANDMSSSNDVIYPYTAILVPLKTKPSPLQLQLPISPPPPPPTPPPPPSPPNGSSNKWVFIGVGIGAACLLLIALSAFLFLSKRRRRHSPVPKLQSDKKSSGEFTPNSLLPITTTTSDDTKSWSAISSGGLKDAVESLTAYKFEELQKATQFFSEANRINGSSVFRGTFDGDDAAVKVMIGDVSLSGDEIKILKRINHSNIIRLSGFCVHQGNTYLVYEFAPCGSLIDCLHKGAISPLSWKQRIQIAYDVANALNYLHNFTHPPLIHKNLNTSNILLDANFRAKVANFGLARAVNVEHEDEDEDGDGGQGFQLTRHVVGTRGYMAPEYIENGLITPKLDVFAFGVVLLELLSGRRASGDEDHTLLHSSISGVLEGDHVRDKIEGFMDASLKREYPLDLAFSMAQLAKSCVAPQINSRPTMAQVSGTLSKILSSTRDWDPSDAEVLRQSRSLSYGR